MVRSAARKKRGRFRAAGCCLSDSPSVGPIRSARRPRSR
jgi:hypothetical protein